MNCAKCNMAAHGWKCTICGRDLEEFDPGHVHGDPPSNRYEAPKCDGCGQADAYCTCKK